MSKSFNKRDLAVEKKPSRPIFKNRKPPGLKNTLSVDHVPPELVVENKKGPGHDGLKKSE